VQFQQIFGQFPAREGYIFLDVLEIEAIVQARPDDPEYASEATIRTRKGRQYNAYYDDLEDGETAAERVLANVAALHEAAAEASDPLLLEINSEPLENQ
jgi:hypothetical protein